MEQPEHAIAVTREIFDRCGAPINTVKVVPLCGVLKWAQHPLEKAPETGKNG